MADAGKLAGMIQDFFFGRKSRDDAIRLYEEDMIAIAIREVRMSTTNMAMVHDW